MSSVRRKMSVVLRSIVMLAIMLSAFTTTPPQVAVAAPATCGAGDPSLVAGTCQVTIDVHDFASGAALANFSYIINVDNTKLPDDPLALSTESNSPIVRIGDQGRTQVTLPDGRYLVSARSLDHKMWGAYFTLPRDAQDNGTLTVRIDLTEQSAEHPLPLGKIRVFVFEDNAWTNGAPDTEEGGLQGFKAGLAEQTGSAVTVDYNNDPLCGSGECLTDGTGFVEIPNLGPATYFIDVHPPDAPCNSDPNSRWYQTTTIDGGLTLWAPTEEGADGTGAPGEQLWEPPNNRTAYWFGFVCAPTPFASAGTGEIVGQARNWVEWAPYTTGTFNDPVEEPFVALSDSTTDQTAYIGRGDGAGNFDITGVPAGDYNLAIWDEQLSYIMRFKPVHVEAGQVTDVNETGDDDSIGVGVSRWFGWLDGHVYKDVNGNGQYDPGVDPAIGNTDMDQRWRDGSIKESTFTDPSGYYQYTNAEGGQLGRWIVNEQGFARFSADPGASVYDEHTGLVTPSCLVNGTPVDPCVPNAQGGGLLMNQLLLEGHRATVDWGKRDYPAGTPGQIVGITYFATTRNEFDARMQAHEDYEPGIPGVTVYLEAPGPDNTPNTDDDVVVNQYVTDQWEQPNASQDPQDNGQGGPNGFTQSCNPIRDFNGLDITNMFKDTIGPNCLEVPLTGEQTKDGAFDGGYAFANYCPDGLNLATGACNDGSAPEDHPLVAGNYIVHAVMPQDATDLRECNQAGETQRVTDAHGAVPGGGQGCLYHIVREEDVNVDLGDSFTPAIPPPSCVGDDHVIDQDSLTARSNYFGQAGAHAPLCDKHLVQLQNGQNANADFFMMTNFRTDPNGENAGDNRTGDVAAPGRLVGQVFNDIYFERNPESPWFGEPRPIAGIPIGIYAKAEVLQAGGGFSMTGREIGRDGASAPEITYDGAKWRLLTTVTTSPDGSFEALVPSTETFNCPIPQGPCPGIYLVTVDDPGFIDGAPGGPGDHSNANYNPNLLLATTPSDAWPGLTTQLDLPLDPISGTACEDPAAQTGPARPELLQVSRPYVLSSDSGAARRITIQADFISQDANGNANTAAGAVRLTDLRTNASTNLTLGSGIVSWTPGNPSTPDTIVIQVPTVSGSFPAGPKQLTIITASSNGGVPSVNGITLHVLGGTGSTRYTPAVVNVAPPPPAGTDPHALQNAIDGATQNSFGEWPLLVLSPGVYNENLLLWKPVKLQGLGPGGIVAAHEFGQRDPEDPRFNIQGTVIDGRYFQQNASAYDATVAAHAPYATDPTMSTILRGADITVVAQSQSAFGATNVLGQARIDGLGLTTGHGDGAGGIQLQAFVNNLQITNDVLENNGGVVAGGISIGQPYAHGSHNYNVRMSNDRVIGNGGLTQAGGIGIFYGANNYEVASSIVCSNFSVNYGAGISHIGFSPNGSIHDNQIYYNESADSGGGIAIESELPVGGGLGDGSGPVDVDRNLIQSNMSVLDDGGGIFVLDALTAEINIRNNMIVDNGAADIGGGIMLDDASNVRIINNTIANNVSTDSSEDSALGVPRSAGLASEQNDPLFQAMLPANAVHYADPVALFNNIFWNNQAYTLDQFGPGATLTASRIIDFGIQDTTPGDHIYTNARYNLFTNGDVQQANGTLFVTMPGGGAPATGYPTDPATKGNIVGADPLFITPFTLELAVSGSRLDPQQAAVTITGTDPPVSLTGDYHLQPSLSASIVSGAIDRGVRCSNTPVPPPSFALAPCTNGGISAPLGTNADIDGQIRPQVSPSRIRTPWDLGADEAARFALQRRG